MFMQMAARRRRMLGFSPLALFAASEPGVWLDPSDLSTLFQDTAGTTPVTAAGQTVGLVLDKSGRGNHATQATAASRPTYQVVSGLPCLVFDGVDDFLVTPTITPGTDKVQVFAGVRKLSDAAIGQILGFGLGDVSAVNGSFALWGPNGVAANYRADVRGDVAGGTGYTATTFTAPTTNVIAVAFDIAGALRADEIPTFRINGVTPSLAAAGSGSAGTGNFGPHVMYMGRRGGTSFPFNGHLYGLITRFGPNLTADQIAQAERWMNSKTGAY